EPRPEGRAVGQAGVHESRGQRQGPGGCQHDRPGGDGGPSGSRRHHHRTYLRQHRYRSGCRSCGKGLPCDSHHAGHHERGAPGSDRRLRRGDYPDAGSGGHGGCCGQGGR
ncbi:DUF1450 domain-containing protein, partial [Dysosmobacter welbionis]